MDTGSGGIFAWVGKRATRDEKKAAFKNAVVRFKHFTITCGPPILCPIVNRIS